MQLPDKMIEESDWIEVRMPLWKLQDLAEKHHLTFQTENDGTGMKELFFWSKPQTYSTRRNIIAQWKRGIARFPYKWHGEIFPAHKLDINA